MMEVMRSICRNFNDCL